MERIEMKRPRNAQTILLALIAIAFSIHVKAQDIVYGMEDSTFIANVIKEHPSSSFPDTGMRIIAIASEFIGKEYIPGTLDSFTDEPLYVSTSRLDCTTFMELVAAMAISDPDKEGAFAGTCRMLEKLRYRNGVRDGYSSRLHYISWWIDDTAKRGIIEERITGHHTAVQRLSTTYMSTHAQAYARLKGNPKTASEIAAHEAAFSGKEIRYIPKENIDLLDKGEIADGDIIAIVTSIEGLDVTHVGFAYWNNDRLHMIHASGSKGAVINDSIPLAEYLAGKKKHCGIRIFRVL